MNHSHKEIYEAGEKKSFSDLKILDLEATLRVTRAENIYLAKKLKDARAEIANFSNCNL